MPATHIAPAQGMLDARIAKAQRLVESGDIETFNGVNVAFVPGSVPGVMHTVVIIDEIESATCSCTAGQHGIVCAHQLAARHVIAQEQS